MIRVFSKEAIELREAALADASKAVIRVWNE